MHDSENLLLILRGVRPTSVCNWRGIHVNDHWTISDTFHGLWLARSGGYTCCIQGKMDVRDMSEIKKTAKVKAKVILQSRKAYASLLLFFFSRCFPQSPNT